MSSVHEDRLAQIAQACRLWQRLPAEQQARDWTYKEAETARQEILRKLVELCEPEVREAVLQDLAGAELCGLNVVPTNEGQEVVGGEDLSAVYTGVCRAADRASKRELPLDEHFLTCISEAIAEEKQSRAKYWNGLKPRALLEALSSTSLPRAVRVIDHLDSEQTHALSRLLYRELGDKPRPLLMDREMKLPAEPTLKQRYAYFHWYIWVSHMHAPESQRALGGVPQIIVVTDGDAILTNKKTGTPSDPLGPIHAKVWPRLGRELNKHKHPIKDPESKNRTAKSIGVTRSTLQRYLQADLPVKLMPDGKGGVYTEYRMDDVLKAVETSSQKKRNKRKPEDS